MAYKNKEDRPYAHEYEMQKKRGEHENRMTRQKARRMLDAEGVPRKGKDIDHKVMLSKGGTNAKSNLRLQSPSKNRSRNGK